MTRRSRPGAERSSDVRRDVIERLSRWSALGGCEGDPEWALLESLSRPEREALECELNRIDASIQQLKAKLRRRDDDLYRS